MNKKIGFIGCGNIAKAMIGGLISSGQIPASHILVFDRKPATNQAMHEQYGILPGESARQVASEADILIGAVKPGVFHSVMADLKTSLKLNGLFVSVATGITLDALAVTLGSDRKIIRAMPNTPALVSEAMTSVTPNALITDEETQQVLSIFNSFGCALVVPENQIHAVIGVSGSAPAYVFMFIEAMADAAVLRGMPRAKAYQFAAQAVKGAAQMVLQSGKHPGELKDMVCSPSGTTIEAVAALENRGFRGVVIEAMQRCMTKSQIMSGEVK